MEKVRELFIGQCHTISSFKGLDNNLGILSIASCENLQLKDVPNKIKNLSIESCHNLTSLEGLENSQIEHVELRDLPKLTTLKGISSTVKELLVFYSAITSMEFCPPKLEKLKVNYCPSFNHLAGITEKVE